MDIEIRSIEYRTGMEMRLAKDFWFMCMSKPNFTWSDEDYVNACFPLECSNGWLYLIYNMCRELLTEVKSDFEFTQIKEKYGVLNVYYNGTITPYGEKIIQQYEKESQYICEYCGKPGEVKGSGWYMTLCDECWKECRK